jgi:hypothetical protein
MRKIFITFFVMCYTLSFYAQPSTLIINQKPVFASGINMAWINFADDLGSFNEAKFTQIVREVKAANGNVIRWWLHTNGSKSPIFTHNRVSGIAEGDLQNLKKALDIAYSNGVLLDLCLWSFDMLQPNAGVENYQRNKDLLEDVSATQAYINNALIPMVTTFKNHPAIYCWEVFNEPEGMTTAFGWTPVKVDIKYVQRFVNLVAGAIHRNAPGKLVSNGSWSFRALTDVDGNTNYYRSDRLVAQGNDKDGYLDFYMVHYYPEHFGESLSPFHHPASYWALDKPLVIGELPAKGIQLGDKSLTTEQAYEYAYNNGYYGIMAWAWTNHDGCGGLMDCQKAFKLLKDKNPAVFSIYK